MGISAGDLREWVEIQSGGRVPNGQGGFVTSWNTVAKVRAEVIPLSGNEAIISQIERSLAQYRVTIRKRKDVTPACRLLWRGQTLAVKAVLPHPRALLEGLLLTCESGKSD